ncbi:MAG: hypothetical protein ABH879_07800 [archaeon]
MDFRDALKSVQNSDVYKDWSGQHKDNYLANAFIMLDVQLQGNWQFGYYTRNNRKITTFSVEGSIKLMPEDDVFQKDKEDIPALNMGSVETGFDDILENAMSFQRKNYPMNNPQKIIVILQNNGNEQMWNLTFLSSSLETLNLNICPVTGKILRNKLTSIFSFGAK